MRIWIFHVGEDPPLVEGDRTGRYGRLSAELAARGHDVTWWTTNFHHVTKQSFEVPYAERAKAGVTHILLPGLPYKKNVSLRRFLHVKLHALRLLQALRHRERPDLVLAAIPTVEAAWIAARFCRTNAVPLVLDVRDEYPEDYVRRLPPSLRALGRVCLAADFAMVRYACRIASAIVGVSARQRAYGLHHAGRAAGPQDAVFYLGAPDTPFDSAAMSDAMKRWRERGLLDTDFVCSFVGSMSQGRPLEPIIAAAQRLSNTVPIRLVLGGDGDLRDKYVQMAGGSDRVIFPGWLKAIDSAALMSLSHVMLAPYRPDLAFSLPTKIFDYMASGRPLLSSCPGEAESLLAEERIGLFYQFDSAEDALQKLSWLHSHPNEARSMGKRARQLFENRFSSAASTGSFAAFLEAATDLRPNQY